MLIVGSILLALGALIALGRLFDWIKEKDYGDQFGLIVLTALIVFILCCLLFREYLRCGNYDF